MEEITINFGDLDFYVVRRDRIGDTIMGSIAHKAMWAMCHKFGYGPLPYDKKIEFLNEYKTQLKNENKKIA